jgi:hypothetical protein
MFDFPDNEENEAGMVSHGDGSDGTRIDGWGICGFDGISIGFKSLH